MTRNIRRFWFFIGIAAIILIAFLWPELGDAARFYRIPNAAIFLAFLITGAKLDTGQIADQVKNLRIPLAATASSLLLIPLFTHWLARLIFADNPDFVVGATLIAAAPVTIASGTVMTGMALGNVPLSLFICIIGNFTALLTMPFMLSLLLQLEHTIELPVIEILGGLVVVVLVPTIIGQLIRPWTKHLLGAWTSPFQQAVVLLIIFNAVSSSSDQVAGAGRALFVLFVFMLLLRTAILACNYAIARLMRLDQPSTSAFTIHVSQKTLTISYLIWDGYFARVYPLAMLPGIVYHLCQMVMDTGVARLFRRRQKALLQRVKSPN